MMSFSFLNSLTPQDKGGDLWMMIDQRSHSFLELNQNFRRILMLTKLFDYLKFALDYIVDCFKLSSNLEIYKVCVLFILIYFFIILIFPYILKISFLFNIKYKIKICIKKLICKCWFCIKFKCVFLVKLIVCLYSLCTKKIKTYLVILIVSSLFYDFLNCIITLIHIAKFRCSAKKPKYFDCAPIDLIDEYGDITDKCRRGGNDYSDKSNPYTEQFEELKSFLENRNVKNLAVFGSYGAGKSSFLKSFFTHYTVNGRRDEDNVIYISLPDFKYTKNDKIINQTHTKHNIVKDNKRAINAKNQFESSEKDSHNLNLETVETEIIRQLIHGKISKNVPVSLFSNLKTDTAEIISISIFILSFITFFFLCKNHNIGIKEFFNIDNYLWLRLLLLLLFFYSIFKYFSKRFRFSNVSFFNVGVSAKDKSEESIFDSYLDEITYLFEESNCRYVVFEDLDRTDNYEVLTHLRNLNFILNNDHRCFDKITGKQRKIVFIYVIRSDIFTKAEETVKFFDASIHVQNVITSANSWEFFINYRDDLCKHFLDDKLKKEFLSKKALTNEFLSNIAFFVTDLRLVKMIFNDYLNILGSLEVILTNIENHNFDFFSEKFFSYAVFRNTYPHESETLLRDEGYIYELLNKKFNYWGKNCNLERVSISKGNKKEISLLINEIQTNKNLKLLYLLLDKKYLSEDYRLYSAVFTKNVFKNEDADRKFFLGILKLSDEFCPELDISEYFEKVVLQYFSYTIFRCLFILNFNFYIRIFKEYYLTKEKEERFNLYLSYIIECCSSKPDTESLINPKHTKFSFILDLMDHLDKLVSEKKENISFFSFCIEIIINSIFKSIDDNNSALETSPIFCNIGSERLLTYIFFYGNINILKNLIKEEPKKNYKDRIKHELERIDNLGKFLFYLVDHTGQMNENFFDSIDFLNFKFKRLTINYSSKKDNTYKFIKILANKLPRRNQLIAIDFFFDPSWFNFSHISQFLIDNNNSASNIPYENCILTSIFTSTSEDFTTFQDAFFRALFSIKQYENILLFNGIEMRNSIKGSKLDYLKDRKEIILFVTYFVNYFILKNKSKDHGSSYFKGFDKFMEETEYLENNNNLKPLHLDKYKFQNKKLSSNEKILLCFLDYEFNEIEYFSISYKKAFGEQDSVYSKFLKKIHYEDSINSLEKEEAKFALVTSLLIFSFIEKQNEFTPRHKITPNINNIIEIKELIDQTYTNENNRDYKISEQTFNSEFNRCWEILTIFFHSFYKEIFASDKYNLYNLSPDFDEQPYSFEKTKQYISSLKKKDN